MGHVGVHHAHLARDAVDGGMDERSRWAPPVPAGQSVALRVDQHDVVLANLAPVQPARVPQEPDGT